MNTHMIDRKRKINMINEKMSFGGKSHMAAIVLTMSCMAGCALAPKGDQRNIVRRRNLGTHPKNLSVYAIFGFQS